MHGIFSPWIKYTGCGCCRAMAAPEAPDLGFSMCSDSVYQASAIVCANERRFFCHTTPFPINPFYRLHPDPLKPVNSWRTCTRSTSLPQSALNILAASPRSTSNCSCNELACIGCAPANLTSQLLTHCKIFLPIVLPVCLTRNDVIFHLIVLLRRIAV